MDEKPNSSMQKKDDASADKQADGSSQKITNFFPVLRPEGRAKMCASKTDDSKQKEMVKKLKGKESMTLRSKRQDKANEKSNSNTANQVKDKVRNVSVAPAHEKSNSNPTNQVKEKVRNVSVASAHEKSNSNTTNQTKEKVRNVSVASALKTPLGQVLRKSIEASDKKEMGSKPNPTKLPESLGKTVEVKKNLSDSESGRTLRQKAVVSEKPKRPYRRKSEPNQTSIVTESLKGIRVDNLKVKTEGHGRPGRPKSTHLIDTVSEEGKSDSNSCNKIRKYRKRHFRGGTYGLYLTPARKKKKKMMSSQDESKDDEGSVTSTENNSFLDSEDANSMVSEDFLTASEKSLVDEEQCLESQTSSVLHSEKKTEKLDFNSSVESKDLSSKEITIKEEKPEPKIEISADYEENTQNVTDLFQDLEAMQWESDQKAERTGNSNASDNKITQYDDISNESFTNTLHFSFKKTSQDSNENLTVEKPETLVDFSSTCDVTEKSNEKIGLSEGSQAGLSNKISEMFDTKSNSNINDLKDDKNENSKDVSNLDLKDNSSIDMKQDSNVIMKDESNTELKDDSNSGLKSSINLKEDSNVGYKDDSNVDMKDDSNVDMKDDSNVDMKDDSNLASSNNSVSKIDLNLLTSDISQIKEDLNLVSTDIISNKDSLNLLFEEDDDDDDDDKINLNISSIVAENKILSNESDDVPEKRNFNLSSVVFNESRENSIQMSCDLNEKVSVRSSPLAAENNDINNSDSPLTSEIKQDSNSVPYAVINKQDSNSLTFPSEDKLQSDSITFNENSKNDADSITFSDKQDSNFETLDIEEKQNSNYSLCANEKEVRDSPNFFKSEVKNETNLRDVTENNSGEIDDDQNKKEIDAESVTFSDKQDSNFETLDVGEKQNSNFSLSVNEKEARNTPNLIENEDKMEVNSHSIIEDKSGDIQDSNQSKKEYVNNNMEVDNQEKDDDDDDDQSTIANCVKSRQRIKRRFTDDIVDTDLGILSVAAMSADKASFKKAIIKSDPPKEVIEHFQSVTRTEAKKSGSAAKIECVFNCKQTPIKSCTCEGDSFQAKFDKNEEESFCQAVDSIDDKLLGCTNPVVTSRLVRPSVKHAFTVMCETHLWRLKHHHACPYCGLFCSQGSFIQCTSGENPRSVHLFHEQCQTKEEGTVPFCFHCGSSASLKRVHLELQMANPPAFFLNQGSKVSVPDVSKARISFSASADFSKKEDDEPTVSIKIEESGKILSSAGLPNSSSKEELEKLISMLNDDKVQSYNYTSDELYDMASIGDVLKVLYMLVKGCDPNERFPNHEGETALHAAAANGHATIVHLLIQAGAVCDSLNEKMYTSLMLAVENAHKEVVHYLVKKGAITDFRGENGMSSLHLAAKSGNLDILKILMSSRDTDIDAQDDGGWTPIVWASEHDHLNVVKYLLKRGANPNIRDNEGNIGLHWSAFSGSVEISYLYLDYGCDINAVNELGDTPLHIAARQDSFPCVTLFLSRGADVTIVNKAEKIPAECCIDKNSDTYLSLSLNMLLKKITKKYQHKAEKIIHRDISRGKEQIAIQCVNAFDDEMPPLDFLYVTENCETMPINIDRTITSLQSCHCEDDCSTASCSCASISYQCWYDKEGLLLPEFNLLDPPMLFECNRACSCWSLNCHNRVLQNGITCRLQLIRTKGKGWGVRTLKDIPKGAFICEYVGELISDSAADKRADDSYLFDLDNRDGETYCLDARYYGNISRFINHLCEPNLVPVKIYVDHQDLNFPRIAFFSSRDIKQYEELGKENSENDVKVVTLNRFLGLDKS